MVQDKARREVVIYGVSFLAKGATIYCETCLVANSFSSRLFIKQYEALH